MVALHGKDIALANSGVDFAQNTVDRNISHRLGLQRSQRALSAANCCADRRSNTVTEKTEVINRTTTITRNVNENTTINNVRNNTVNKNETIAVNKNNDITIGLDRPPVMEKTFVPIEMTTMITHITHIADIMRSKIDNFSTGFKTVFCPK